MEKIWTPSEVSKLFRINRTKTSLFRDEAQDIIPRAQRIQRGQTQVRAWTIGDLPLIGRVHGFLKPPAKSQILAIYTAKGGVLKTTFAYNLARCLALNGVRTLVIGLDVQCSITDLLTVAPQVEALDEVSSYPGLYDAAKPLADGGVPINQVIQVSDLPTLHFIPENINLNLLEQRIRDEKRREHFLARLLEPLKEKYEVIIFDNGPSWNFLIQNSLVAAKNVISPVGCDIGTYRSITQNIGLISNYKKDMDLVWNNFLIVPTLLEKTKLSSQIEAQYRTMYPEFITTTSIRRAVKGQESIVQNASVLETDATSPLANDYFEVIGEVWTRISGNA